MLKLVLPKGSLERATLELFDAADLPVRRSSSVEYQASIDDPRIAEVAVLRPQEIPRYVASGLFDLGITGEDWIEETGTEHELQKLGTLSYSKATSNPIRVVLAVAEDSPVRSVEDLKPGVRINTEYREVTRNYLARHGITEAEITLSHGATEAKVALGVADAVVEITETGRALRNNGLRIVDEVMTSSTVLVANRAALQDSKKAHAMDQLLTLLQGTLEARGNVLVKLNVSDADLSGVIELLPAMKSPTVSSLRDGGYAVETVVPKADINILIPALKDAGASDIIELPLAKIVH
jgi:ATP phosphoribosyltransferase